MSICSDPEERTDQLNKLFGSLDWESDGGRRQPLRLEQRGLISPKTEGQGTKPTDLSAPNLSRMLHQESDEEEEIKFVRETKVSELEPGNQPEQAAKTEQTV